MVLYFFLPICILGGVLTYQRIRKELIYCRTTTATVIAIQEKFPHEYIVEYMADGTLYRENYYRKTEEGTMREIRYNPEHPEQFILH